MVSQTMVNALRKVINMMIQKDYKEKEGELKAEMEATREEIIRYTVEKLISRNAVISDLSANEDGSVTVTIIPLDSNAYQRYMELLDMHRDLRLKYHELLEKLEIWYGLTMARKDDLVDPPELPAELKSFLARAEVFLEE